MAFLTALITVTIPASAAANSVQQVRGVGFQPKVLRILHASNAKFAASSGLLKQSDGWAVLNGGVVTQCVQAATSRDEANNAATSKVRVIPGAIWRNYANDTSAGAGRASVSAMVAGGFDLTVVEPPPADVLLHVACLGGDEIDGEVLAFNVPAAGTQTLPVTREYNAFLLYGNPTKNISIGDPAAGLPPMGFTKGLSGDFSVQGLSSNGPTTMTAKQNATSERPLGFYNSSGDNSATTSIRITAVSATEITLASSDGGFRTGVLVCLKAPVTAAGTVAARTTAGALPPNDLGCTAKFILALSAPRVPASQSAQPDVHWTAGMAIGSGAAQQVGVSCFEPDQPGPIDTTPIDNHARQTPGLLLESQVYGGRNVFTQGGALRVAAVGDRTLTLNQDAPFPAAALVGYLVLGVPSSAVVEPPPPAPTTTTPGIRPMSTINDAPYGFAATIPVDLLTPNQTDFALAVPIETGDFRWAIDGGTAVDIPAASVAYNANGVGYRVSLTAAQLRGKRGELRWKDKTATPVFAPGFVIVSTSGHPASARPPKDMIDTSVVIASEAGPPVAPGPTLEAFSVRPAPPRIDEGSIVILAGADGGVRTAAIVRGYSRPTNGTHAEVTVYPLMQPPAVGETVEFYAAPRELSGADITIQKVLLPVGLNGDSFHETALAKLADALSPATVTLLLANEQFRTMLFMILGIDVEVTDDGVIRYYDAPVGDPDRTLVAERAGTALAVVRLDAAAP